MCRSVDLWDLHFGGRCDDNDDNYQNEVRPVFFWSAFRRTLFEFRVALSDLADCGDTSSKVINGEETGNQRYLVPNVCRCGKKKHRSI